MYASKLVLILCVIVYIYLVSTMIVEIGLQALGGKKWKQQQHSESYSYVHSQCSRLSVPGDMLVLNQVCLIHRYVYTQTITMIYHIQKTCEGERRESGSIYTRAESNQSLRLSEGGKRNFGLVCVVFLLGAYEEPITKFDEKCSGQWYSYRSCSSNTERKSSSQQQL